MKDRIHSWDWLRAFALLVMFVGHSHFVFDSPLLDAWDLTIGRFVFPAFGMIAAWNFCRSEDMEKILSRFIPWAILAEPAFFLLTGTFGNIILQMLFAFAFVYSGRWVFAVAASLCAYGPFGFAALVIWSSASVRWSLAGGLISNPLPFAWLSGAFSAFVLWVSKLQMPRFPFALHRFFGNAYLLHLYALAGIKLWRTQHA